MFLKPPPKYLTDSITDESSTKELFDIIPKEQFDAVWAGSTATAEIDDTFLGFTLTYKLLSLLIPTHWTVVDLGCGYNAQSWYFREHKAILSINTPDEEDRPQPIFKSPNCEEIRCTIKEFIESDRFKELDLDETFAILNYVPPWYDDNCKLARDNFTNVYTYYPSMK